MKWENTRARVYIRNKWSFLICLIAEMLLFFVILIYEKGQREKERKEVSFFSALLEGFFARLFSACFKATEKKFSMAFLYFVSCQNIKGN